ncbi:MAG TPA: NAD(+) diphosphatase [Candidatus Nanopelagicales bacterium]
MPEAQPVVAIDPIPLALGQGTLDRRADLRTAGWPSVPATRRVVLLDEQGEAVVQRAADRTAVLVDGASLTTHQRPDGLLGDAAPANGAGERPASATPDRMTPDPGTPGPRPSDPGMPDPTTPADPDDILLGVDEQGRAVLGRVLPRDAITLPAGAEWASLRSVGLRLPAEDRALFAELLALANWHARHTHCPRCGAPTTPAGLGWWRTCIVDGSEHYPRTDPAVIAILVDEAGNALLGRQVVWPVGAFSTLAGFVEPGESAERAVLREIAEEVGLRPEAVAYVASQPWPFPASLMLGFEARISGVRPTPRVDGVEIAEARWLSREELPDLAEAREVRLPGRLSIAHQLVRRWFGSEIPDSWCRW